MVRLLTHNMLASNVKARLLHFAGAAHDAPEPC
jgi:hypothetical protein